MIPLNDGVNELYFLVPAAMTNEELRFDPGASVGNYAISTIEAKPLSMALPFRISRAMLFQRPNIDK